jgi:signal transduction histidine kinase/CheY-like chemotaxis protein
MQRSDQVEHDRGVFLSTLPAGRGQRRLALAAVLSSLVIFVGAVPFAKVQLPPVSAFIPMYQSALVVNDLITAILLFGQFSILRSRALLVLASGYLFTAFMAFAHTLSFPGLFAPTGLLGAGPQTTAWLYMFWHAGFPLLVIVYALLKSQGREPSHSQGRASLTVACSVAVVLAVAGGVTLLATAGQTLLPPIMRGNNYTPVMLTVVSSVWVASLVALVVLWWRRPHSVLDLWLMVVMCAWLFDIALAAVLNAGRFDLGFYAGRIYGLLAASFVLVVLLLEHSQLYARLVEVHREVERQNRSLEQIVAERTQRLLQSEKVATMGSLLAGVAHELNNPLAIVMAHAHMLGEGARDTALRLRAEKINAAAERCARIVKNFLAIARQRPPERSTVHLNSVVKDAIEILAYELRTGNVEVVFDLAAGLPALWADAHQLQQVLVNLVTNAHHAMRSQDGPRQLRIGTRLNGSRVHLTITDTGPGIPLGIREKVFEPFFTTKPAGEGTGLGLSLCHGIIEEHGGTITLESEPGRGATFLIELPVAERPASAAGVRPAEPLPAVGPGRLLVVDDEPDIAGVLREILEQAGHRVDTVDDGVAALKLLGQHAYDLVLSDTKMPGLDGVTLYREIERRFPALCGRFVFLTGDVLDRDKRKFLESTGVPCLVKPFEVQEVRRLVHRLLSTQ